MVIISMMLGACCRLRRWHPPAVIPGSPASLSLSLPLICRRMAPACSPYRDWQTAFPMHLEITSTGLSARWNGGGARAMTHRHTVRHNRTRHRTKPHGTASNNLELKSDNYACTQAHTHRHYIHLNQPLETTSSITLCALRWFWGGGRTYEKELYTHTLKT